MYVANNSRPRVRFPNYHVCVLIPRLLRVLPVRLSEA